MCVITCLIRPKGGGEGGICSNGRGTCNDFGNTWDICTFSQAIPVTFLLAGEPQDVSKPETEPNFRCKIFFLPFLLLFEN